ncbi:MAG: hypothetical protein WCM76_06760 [Bacteroidota bacterium]
MTREEALELFDLSNEASNDDILEKYREMYSDFMLRLTNAPTPNLKKIYNQNIQKLEDAFRVLCPDAEVDQTQFLPTDKPLIGTSPSNININISNKVESKKDDKKPQNKPLKSKGLPVMFLLGSVIFFAVGLSFFIMFMKRDKVMKGQETIISKLRADSTQLHSSFAPFMKNGKLKIANKSEYQFTITRMSVLFLDENKQLKHLAFFWKYPLDPGKTTPVLEYYGKDVRGNSISWDGSVLFYAFYITTPGGGYGYIDGIWTTEQKDGDIILKQE